MTLNIDKNVYKPLRKENKKPISINRSSNLDKNVYKPFRNKNNKPISINICSNHSPSILRQLQKSIEKRISETLSDKDTFDESIKTYKDVLKESGFKYALIYIPAEANSRQWKRNRNEEVIWFHSPYSRSVKINFGKVFTPTFHTLSEFLKMGRGESIFSSFSYNN